MHDNNVISDPCKIANEFNNFLVKVGPSLASSMPCNNGDVFDYLGKYYRHYHYTIIPVNTTVITTLL